MRDIDVVRELSDQTNNAIANGEPVSIYKSHSWITMALVDGEMQCGMVDGQTDEKVCFQAFNSKNTVLIIEQSNEQQVSKYCKKAKVIVAGKGAVNPYNIDSLEYVAEIEINIIKAFSYLFS